MFPIKCQQVVRLMRINTENKKDVCGGDKLGHGGGG